MGARELQRSDEAVEAMLEQQLDEMHVLQQQPKQEVAVPTYVYDFGVHKTDGDGTMKELLGGKGANLAAVAKLGLPCPPGFTLSTEVCRYFYQNDRQYPPELARQVAASMTRLEEASGGNKKFGDGKNPLLVSVRSGARKSMPGMMDTVLNLGLNDETVRGLAAASSGEDFAYDCYRRFLAAYADVVLGVKPKEDEVNPFDAVLLLEGLTDGKAIVERYKAIIKERTGADFPQDPYEQLWFALSAVFGSWENERARLYRQKYGIPSDWGTAVNVQTMVFGNAGTTSATGVAFTRNPATGENELYGEYLVNAQGEDVVAGVRTPRPISELEKDMPESYETLSKVRETLETNFRDMQDLEFTIENGTFYLLQTRDGKRTGLAATRIAYEMVEEGILEDANAALLRIPPDSLGSLLAPTFDYSFVKKEGPPLTSGLPAGPGAATGHITFSANGAELLAKQGNKAILCRHETTPDDLRGMLSSEGVLTTRGGVSSHAALVARQMGKVCVCGAGDIAIDYEKGTLTIYGGEPKKKIKVLKEGEAISIDGSTGAVYAGVIPTAPSEVNRVLAGDLPASESKTYQMFESILSWADNSRRLSIRANVDTPKQAELAVKLGAEGVGLCRTEHMFFEGERLDLFRRVILAADDGEERKKALAKLLPLQRQDFFEMLAVLEGRPLTVRLLDPPLHEFTPHDTGSIANLAENLQVPFDRVNERCAALREANPMLGHRGCRLAISYPEICETQARALFEAADLALKSGSTEEVNLEIMVPFVGFKAELDHQVAIIKRVAQEVNPKIPFKVGTMIELPRAALTAGDIAETAEFFSFGTNDLSQMTLGMSRDDSSSFLPTYLDHEVVHHNPFSTIDQIGVGQLVGIAVARGKQARPDLHLGACGEHGGDPQSIHFFHNAGLHYVSCSAPRVPIARLAAAQANLQAPRGNLQHGKADEKTTS